MGSPKAYFLSDLHLFAKRSNAEAIRPALLRAAKEGQHIVLGGDIFDFRWSHWQDHATTVQQSVRWLEDLLTSCDSCRIHYLLGNHDASQAFVEQLENLSRIHANLEWHPHWMRLQDCVFLHGDIIDARIPLSDDFHDRLDRLRRSKEDRLPPAKIQHALYDVAVTTRAHRIVASLANPKSRVLDRVTRYLDWAGLGPDAGVQHVYFGHTHRAMENVPFAGMTFHNPGATIRGIPFRMLEVPLSQRNAE